MPSPAPRCRGSQPLPIPTPLECVNELRHYECRGWRQLPTFDQFDHLLVIRAHDGERGSVLRQVENPQLVVLEGGEPDFMVRLAGVEPATLGLEVLGAVTPRRTSFHAPRSPRASCRGCVEVRGVVDTTSLSSVQQLDAVTLVLQGVERLPALVFAIVLGGRSCSKRDDH